MKKSSIKILFRLFVFLSDKTNGFAPFVKYKLTLGALLIGIGTSSSCSKAQSTDVRNTSDSIIENPTCYKPAMPSKVPDSISDPEDETVKNETKTPKFNPPIVEDTYIEEEYPVMCYVSIVISEPEEPVKPKDEAFRVVEQMPAFAGGNEALIEFIQDNLRYPENDEEISGRVIVEFIVRSNGSIENVTVLRSLDARFDKEAVRLVQSMPQWIPGKQNGNPVDVYFTLPIRFRIIDEEKKH